MNPRYTSPVKQADTMWDKLIRTRYVPEIKVSATKKYAMFNFLCVGNIYTNPV